MEDLHWFQRFLHIFFFNLIVFGLFYILFSQQALHNFSPSAHAQAVRTSSR
jgi:hypothetical protein